MSVLEDTRGSARWLTIDREDRRNALSPGVIRGLIEGLSRAADDPAARVVVITGAGDRAFCAGGDIGAFGDGGEPARLIGDLLGAVRSSPRPVIARVNGRALGGGFGLMLACDLAVAADDVEVGLPEIDLGLWPHVVTAIVQRVLPSKVALELMLTGRRASANEACRWGVVTTLAPRSDLDAAVDGIAAVVAGKSAHVIRLGKASFRGAEGLGWDEAVAYLSEQLEENLGAEDLAEGVQAFLEKRPPRWRDR